MSFLISVQNTSVFCALSWPQGGPGRQGHIRYKELLFTEYNVPGDVLPFQLHEPIFCFSIALVSHWLWENHLLVFLCSIWLICRVRVKQNIFQTPFTSQPQEAYISMKSFAVSLKVPSSYPLPRVRKQEPGARSQEQPSREIEKTTAKAQHPPFPGVTSLPSTKLIANSCSLSSELRLRRELP